jgi:hypothetical protein
MIPIAHVVVISTDVTGSNLVLRDGKEKVGTLQASVDPL